MINKQLLPVLLILICSCNKSQSDKQIDKKEIKDTVGEIISIHKDTTVSSLNKYAISPIDTIYIGDINSDKKLDTAYIILPKFKTPNILMSGCIDDKCSVTVKFSGSLPSFTFNECVHGAVFNITDIDKDGKSELMFIPSWFQGCWGNMYIYSLKNNQWINQGSAHGYLCSEEDFRKRVKKINNTTIEVLEDVPKDGDYGFIIKKPKRIFLKK